MPHHPQTNPIPFGPAQALAVPGFAVGEKLGEGGMGVVYRATDAEFGRPVAVKVMKTDRPSPDAVRRFLDEARITGRLQHPGVPPAYRLGLLADGRPFLAMKLIDGRTWADLLRDRDRPGDDLARHLHIFEQVCQTVAYAHGQGVIHRDLKPANVMVGAFGEVQVMDWGLAEDLADRGRTPLNDAASAPGAHSPDVAVGVTQGATDPGRGVGTPAYMSPEQANGHDELDPRTDVFALGAILCQILTGEPPYRGPYAVVAAREANLAEAVALLDGCGADGELVALVRRCLSPDPADRPADAGAVAEAVGAYRAGVERRLREAEQEHAAAKARSTEQSRRRRVQRWLAGALALLVAGGGAFAWYADHQATYQTARAGSARDALGAALDQAEASLRADRPAEAKLALGEASRRLDADPHADPDGGLAGRLADLDGQREFLVDLDAIRGRYWTVRDRGLDDATTRRELSAAFHGRGLDLADPDALARRLEGWAVRDQVVGALDLLLLVAPEHPDLRGTLARLDPGPAQDAWRAAYRPGNDAGRREAAKGLIAARPSPRFVAAYASAFPRDAGLVLLDDAWAAHPSNFSLAFVLAWFLQRGDASQQDEAVGYYRVCLGLRPGDLGTLNNLCVLLLDRGRAREAVAVGRRAVRGDPPEANQYYNLGRALHAVGELDEALAAYRRALDLNPRFANVHVEIGEALRAKGDPEGAAAAYQTAIDLEPCHPIANHNLGNHFYGRGDVRRAEACYRAAIAGPADYAPSRNNLALIVRDRGDVDEAIGHFRAAVRADPTHAKAFRSLGRLLIDKGEFADAVAALRRGHDLGSADPAWRQRAAEWLQEAVTLRDRDGRLPLVVAGAEAPDTAAGHLDFADLCWRYRQRHADAACLYAEAFRLDPALVDLRQGTARYDAACAAVRAANGEGINAPPGEVRNEMRRIALGWLRDDLTAGRAIRNDPIAGPRLAAYFEAWLKDPDLASVREADGLAKLPAAERRAWEAFWADVRRMLDETQPEGL